MTYPLPSEPMPRDIIRRSIVMHPTLLAEALDRAAATHRAAAASMMSRQACQAAHKLAHDCADAANALRAVGDVDALTDDFMAAGLGVWTSVLIQAARLQCLPQSVASQACERLDASTVA